MILSNVLRIGSIPVMNAIAFVEHITKEVIDFFERIEADSGSKGDEELIDIMVRLLKEAELFGTSDI